VISLSLVSHTNVGKTTLARTLLGQDIGEVRDAPHVTEFAEEHLLQRSPTGDELILADTPGFGDSVRLVRRMRHSGNPLGWFLTEVWDRWRDRPFWASQQALRQVRDRADVVVYLVNAAEEPAAAGYVAPEMELLAWVGKPVLVLLNQMGAPREPAAEAADVQRWRTQLAVWPLVKAVLPLDAFARCWVQEGALWQQVEQALESGRRPEMARLRAAWNGQRLATFDAAMQALADSLGRVAAAHVALDGTGGLRDTLRQLGSAIGLTKTADPRFEAVQQVLASQLDDEVRASTGRLLALHGLRGEAGGTILERVATNFELRRKVGESSAALIGAVASGALTGLATDIATGGFTLGGGMIAGGLLGALGAAGIARGLNVVRGTERSWAGWHAEALTPVLRSALLRYLAVAHFGRGRGLWNEGEAPVHWPAIVDAALATQGQALTVLWQGRQVSFDNPGEADALSAALKPLLVAAARDVLEQLYPGTWPEDDKTSIKHPTSPASHP
jgi:hypothetical protein